MKYSKIITRATLLLLFVSAAAAAAQLPMLFYGEASWYGGRFQGKKTASGEIFDTNKLTAAHKKLPFGTLVRVVNLQNEKSVVVRINDRGPFVKGRVLDLSFAAAQALGFERKGTAHVEVRVLKLGKGAQSASTGNGTTVALRSNRVQNSSAAVSSAGASSSSKAVLVPVPVKGDQTAMQSSTSSAVTVPAPLFRSSVSGYVIQVGAFSRKANASKLVRRLRSSGLDAFVNRSGRWLRVWVGSYGSRSKAEADLPKVKQQFRDAYIRKS